MDMMMDTTDTIGLGNLLNNIRNSDAAPSIMGQLGGALEELSTEQVLTYVLIAYLIYTILN